MKALVLAGGEGRRLRPILGDLPKCLADVQGRPFIEHQIELLKSEGITEFVLCVGLGANLVRGALGDGRRLGISIEYSYEEEPLGTGGAIKNASSYIGPTFVCINGDTLVEFSLRDMEEVHSNSGAVGTILFERASVRGRGTLELASDGRVLAFSEKVEPDACGYINCGYYLMEKEILEHIPTQRCVSLEREIFPELLSSGLKLFAVKARGAFVDIGTPKDYLLIREKGWKK